MSREQREQVLSTDDVGVGDVGTGNSGSGRHHRHIDDDDDDDDDDDGDDGDDAPSSGFVSLSNSLAPEQEVRSVSG